MPRQRMPRYEVKHHEKPLVDLVVQYSTHVFPEALHSAADYNIREIATVFSKRGMDIGKGLESFRKILFEGFNISSLDINSQKQVLAWVKRKIWELGRLPTKEEILEHRLARLHHDQMNRKRILETKDALQKQLDSRIEIIMAEAGYYKINHALAKKASQDPRIQVKEIQRAIAQKIQDGKAEELISQGIISAPFRKWTNPSVRRKVVRAIIEILGLKHFELNGFYFQLFGLRSLLLAYGSSPGKAVVDAFGLRPWEAKKVHFGFFKERNTKIDAMKWLLEKTGKTLDDLIISDLLNHGLSGLLRGYNNNLITLKKDLGPGLK